MILWLAPTTTHYGFAHDNRVYYNRRCYWYRESTRPRSLLQYSFLSLLQHLLAMANALIIAYDEGMSSISWEENWYGLANVRVFLKLLKIYACNDCMSEWRPWQHVPCNYVYYENMYVYVEHSEPAETATPDPSTCAEMLQWGVGTVTLHARVISFWYVSYTWWLHEQDTDMVA